VVQFGDSIEQGISSRMLKRADDEDIASSASSSSPRHTAATAAPPTPPPDLEDTDISSSHNDGDSPDSKDDDEYEWPDNPPPDFELPSLNTDEDEAEGEDVPLHGEIPVEPEDIHKNKWQQYQLDKAELLEEGWTVIKTGNSNQGISVGAKVKTRGRNSREGQVVGQTEIGVPLKKHWLVDLGGDEPELMTPMQIQLVERSEAQNYEWTLVVNSSPDEATAPVEYDDIGLAGFNFPESFKPSTGGAYEYPYLKLLQKMWPGDWKAQLRQLNLRVTAENASYIGKKNWRDIHPISEQEWWIFIGIVLSAGPHGRGGGKLWEKTSCDGYFGMTQPINYGPTGLNIMPEYRFRDIKRCFSWSFQDKSKADKATDDYDPWNMILLMVNGYNKNRHDWMAGSVRKVLDETMSAWCPQTTPTGGLPHLSFILRKPEPLGTEFKTIACTVTGKKSTMVAVCFIPRYNETSSL
jgi:hypothetical protein